MPRTPKVWSSRRRRVGLSRVSNAADKSSCYDVISIFSRWRPPAILDLIWVMLDHPRSAIVGVSSVLKFGLDPIYNFGDIAIFIFFSVLA